MVVVHNNVWCWLTRCSMVHLFFLSMFPPSPPSLSLLSALPLSSRPPSLSFSPSTLAVSCPRWRRGAVPLSELCAAGALKIRLSVVCFVFSRNIKDTKAEWCNIWVLLWDGWARMVCLWNQSERANKESIGLAKSHFYSLWIFKYISFVRFGFQRHKYSSDKDNFSELLQWCMIDCSSAVTKIFFNSIQFPENAPLYYDSMVTFFPKTPLLNFPRYKK